MTIFLMFIVITFNGFSGHADVVKHLVEVSNVDAEDKWDRSALIYAARNGNLILTKKHVDVNVQFSDVRNIFNKENFIAFRVFRR